MPGQLQVPVQLQLPLPREAPQQDGMIHQNDGDCRDLYAAVDRRAGEAARIQRQVTIMAAVRPTHQDEYETLQAELVRLFTLYQSRQAQAIDGSPHSKL